MVVAEGINQTCGFFNIYCQGAVWFIRGLDAIFGSDSAQSKFRQKYNRSVEERWSRTEAKWRSAATGFMNE
ncbi:MAG: hypothetical protein KC505_10755 [Myxococcales bacterium]|nr:hypothetical protein [Myxococcales bacterium]USN50045.1 MAG: hypothetical protein H6731_07160 [Myxococcales bacterium]